MSTIPQPRFYVYILARPDETPFYVGKGQGNRINAHEQQARKGHRCHKCSIIRKIWRTGGEVQKYIVLTTDDEQEALAHERELIALLGWETLCNVSSGGEPATAVYSKEYRDKRRRIQLANFKNPDFVKRYRAGVARRQVPVEHLRKMAEIRNADPEYRERLTASIRAHHADPEYREQARQHAKVAWENPKFREAELARLQARSSDPKMKAQIANKVRDLWKDPEYRARQMASRKHYKTPEFREKLRQAQLNRRKKADDGEEETGTRRVG